MAPSQPSPPVDLDRALLDPAGEFVTPEALCAHDGLSTAQKIEILRRWEYDASELCVATEEGMPGGESDLLRRILLCIDQLGGMIDVAQVGPTKQHGIPRSGVKRR